MFPFFARFFRMFARDEAFFERVCRAVLMAFATGGVAFGDQLATAAGLPRWGQGIKVAGMVCGFLSLLIPAGQKNPEEHPAILSPVDPPPPAPGVTP